MKQRQRARVVDRRGFRRVDFLCAGAIRSLEAFRETSGDIDRDIARDIHRAGGRSAHRNCRRCREQS